MGSYKLIAKCGTHTESVEIGFRILILYKWFCLKRDALRTMTGQFQIYDNKIYSLRRNSKISMRLKPQTL